MNRTTRPSLILSLLLFVCCGALVSLDAPGLRVHAAQATEFYLSDGSWNFVRNGWGPVEKDMSCSN